MQYIIIAIVVIIGFAIKSFYDNRAFERKLTNRLKKDWGNVPVEEYSSEKFKALKEYYLSIKKDTDVDDITWNDIDMDTIFMLMNNTNCAMGEEYLYALLHQLSFNEKELKKREELITFFMEQETERLEIQKVLRIMGKLKDISLFEYINSTEGIEKHNSFKHYLMALSLPFSLICIVIGPYLGISPTVGILLFIICLFNNIIQYYKRKAGIEKYFIIFLYILRLLNSVKRVSNLKIPELQEYLDYLKKSTQVFRKFKRGSSLLLIDTKRGEGGLGDIFLDYIRMLFHVDLIKFDSMLAEIRKHKDVLNGMFETIGLLDSMIAVASFRTMFKGQYSIPILEKSQKPFLEIRDAYHPMVDNPVKNSIKENRSVLITGSNASGKSTFLKTMAINGILAQTIHTSTSSYYHSSYFKIYSSMALKDDLLGSESYYIVEIKSLKRILETASLEIPTLCFVDEVLRGTNTLERIAASAQILDSFSKKNVLCFAATHDIELTHILEKRYGNYHFQEEVHGNDIIFDYKLYQGRAISRNAIKLLGLMGYEQEIIDKASSLANHFLESGTWSNLS